MKYGTQISSIIVALLFIYATNFQGFLLLNYHLNQEEITALFCINKDKPVMQCNGKCHLAQQLEQTDQESDTPFSSPSARYNLEINSFLTASEINLSHPSVTRSLKRPFLSEKPILREKSVDVPPPIV